MLLYEILSLIGIAVTAATLPLIAELLVLSAASLLPGRRAQGGSDGGSILPQLTVLIPAHNEEALVGRCVRSVLASRSSGLDVVVVAHNCSDGTAERAAAAGARVMALDDPEQTGKGCALSYGFSAALAGPTQGVLVIDADSVIDLGLTEMVRKRLAAGAAALQCRYETSVRDDERTKLPDLAFYAFNVIRARGRSRLGLSAGIFGNGFALHRDVLTRVPYAAHSIVEDLEYHLALVRAKIRVEYLDAYAVRGEMPVASKNAQAQRARWEGGRLRVMKQWAPRLLADVLRGRLRFVEPLLDLLALPIASGVTLLFIAACLPIAWLRLYVLGAFAVLLFHLTVAAVSGPGLRRTVLALSDAPGYILWKLRILPAIWRTSRTNAAWVRTERESRADS